ncbi:MAG TPA: GNAT family N-acetyltransferase [Solimonas sp.]|nr:GNAT family N-acetyltransferase [Solimonas sp.]
MTHVIRLMDPQDVPACLELWRDTEGVVLREESDSPEALARFLERNPGLSFVAVDQGLVIGSILCGHDGRRAHVYHLAVRTELRRTRCATALLEAAIRALAAEGITRCHAYIRARNLTALGFWSSVGATLRRDIDVMTLTVDTGER